MNRSTEYATMLMMASPPPAYIISSIYYNRAFLVGIWTTQRVLTEADRRGHTDVGKWICDIITAVDTLHPGWMEEDKIDLFVAFVKYIRRRMKSDRV